MQAGGREIEVGGRAGPAGGEQDDVGNQVLAGCQAQQPLPVAVTNGFDLLDGIATTKDDVAPAHLVNQLVANLMVQELERPRALIDHRDLYPQRGKHRGVFDADDAGADHGHRPRQV